MEDCSTYLLCDGISIIVLIIRVVLNIWYLVLLLYVCIYNCTSVYRLANKVPNKNIMLTFG